MYRVAICDDEQVFLSDNRVMVESVLGEAGIAHEISIFSAASDLASAFSQRSDWFDMLLLDILLDSENGVELARRLRTDGYQGSIVFVTSTKDFSLDGYSVYPIQYLLKPLQRDALREALLRDCAGQRALPSLSVPIRGGFTTVLVSGILYLEALLRSIILHTKDRDIESTMSLKEVQAALPQGAFVRCHKSFLVPMAQIRDMSRADITLKCGQRVPIGRVYYDDALAQFIEYIQGK